MSKNRPGDRRLPLLVVDVVSNKPPRPVVTRLFRSLLLNSVRAAGVAAIRIGKATAQSDSSRKEKSAPTATHRENRQPKNSPGPIKSGRLYFLAKKLKTGCWPYQAQTQPNRRSFPKSALAIVSYRSCQKSYSDQPAV